MGPIRRGRHAGGGALSIALSVESLVPSPYQSFYHLQEVAMSDIFRIKVNAGGLRGAQRFGNPPYFEHNL